MSGPPFSALAVANEFIVRARDAGKHIDPLKLQKLLYFAHGWHLAVTGQPLLNERIEAWDYGPVVPGVYHEFKHLGAGRIKDLGERYKPDEDRFYTPRVPRGATEVHEVLDAVWGEYGKHSGVRLSDMSHEEGSPWDLTVKKARSSPYGFRRNQDIDDALIHRYFLKLAKRES